MSTTQLVLELGHRPALGRDDYLVSGENAEAVAWIDRWPDWPDSVLTIAGPPGSGKSHLAAVWQKTTGADVLDADRLRDDTLLAQAGDAPRYILDDAEQLLTSAAVSERAMFHLLNLVRERRGFLLMAGIAPPSRWPTGLPDLRSRLAAVPVAEIGAPDDALLAAVLVKQFGDRQLKVGEDVVAYLLPRMERSLDEARRLVAHIDSRALAHHRNITVPLVREVLTDHTKGG